MGHDVYWNGTIKVKSNQPLKYPHDSEIKVTKKSENKYEIKVIGNYPVDVWEDLIFYFTAQYGFIVDAKGGYEYRGEYEEAGDISVSYRDGKIILTDQELGSDCKETHIYRDRYGTICQEIQDNSAKNQLQKVVDKLTNEQAKLVIQALSQHNFPFIDLPCEKQVEKTKLENLVTRLEFNENNTFWLEDNTFKWLYGDKTANFPLNTDQASIVGSCDVKSSDTYGYCNGICVIVQTDSSFYVLLTQSGRNRNFAYLWSLPNSSLEDPVIVKQDGGHINIYSGETLKWKFFMFRYGWGYEPGKYGETRARLVKCTYDYLPGDEKDKDSSDSDDPDSIPKSDSDSSDSDDPDSDSD